MYKAQHLTVDVGFVASLKFPANVARHSLDVGLQHVNVGKNGIVDALQHIIGRPGLYRCHLVRIVNQPGSKR